MAGETHESTLPLVSEGAPRLRIVVRESPEKSITVDCRRVVTLIGSRPGCKLQLRHRHIDPVHLALVHTGTELLAVDLATEHGSQLNGLKLEHEKLTDGDRISLGPWDMDVHVETAPGDGGSDVHPVDLEPTPQLIALEHLTTHRILQPTRKVVVLGRRNACDIAIPGSDVSRAHAILFTYFGHPALLDLLSRNETLVNDEPISFRMLRSDDVITIGDTRFRLRIHEGAVPKATKNGRNGTAALKTAPDDSSQAPIPLEDDSVAGDLVDIKATEGSQRWAIADSMARSTGRRG